MLFFLLLIFIVNCDDITFMSVKSNKNYEPIRLKVYHKFLDQDNPNYKLFKKSIKEVKKFVETTYNVKRIKHKLVLDSKMCHHVKVPKKHRKKGVKNTDFILYITETFEDASWIAKSSPCVYDQNYRPLAGQINLNNKHFQNLKKIDRFEKLSTIVHEFTHTLGFHRRVMDHFNMTEFIDDKLYLKSNGIINYAQQFYNCDSLTHIPLEDDGGPTAQFSHFEKMTFNQEIMTGTASKDTVYSKFTMLVLQDTSLYRANLDKAGRYEWGMNQGCLAAQGGCDSPTICRIDENERFCSYNYQHIQLCKPSQKLAECGLKYTMKDCYKKRCFNMVDSIHKAKCLKSECTFQGIRVQYKGEVKYCQSDYSTIIFGDLEFECPEYKQFCTTYSECNNKGDLINGKCECQFGFRGKKCQKFL